MGNEGTAYMVQKPYLLQRTKAYFYNPTIKAWLY